MPASLVGGEALVGGRVVMMALAKRDEPEQVLVRMIPAARPAARSATPQTESPAQGPAAGQECVTFYESSRSGNIGIAVTSSPRSAYEETGVAERILAAEQERLPIRPRDTIANTELGSRSALDGAPSSTTLHAFRPCGSLDSAPSENEVIGHIMASDSKRPAAAALLPSPKAAMHQPPIDPQLSRIVDAWPGLAPTARQAVIAILDALPHASGAIPGDAGRVDAERRKPARAKDRAAPARTEPRRRRSRKPASPPQ